MRETKRPGDREAYEERLRYELKFLNYMLPWFSFPPRAAKAPKKSFRSWKKLPPPSDASG